MGTEYSAFEAPQLIEAPSGAPTALPAPESITTHLPTPVPPPPPASQTAVPNAPLPPLPAPPAPPAAAAPTLPAPTLPALTSEPAAPLPAPAMDTPAQQSFAPPSGAPVELNSAEPAQLPRLQLEAPQPTIDTSTAPLPAIVPAPDDEAPPHTERPSTGSVWRRRIPLIVGFLLIVAAVVLAVQAFREFGAANDTTPVEDSSRPASPILEPIDDAQDVVDDINGTATEALDELGLDPTGRPQPLGYRFTTIDALGTSLTVTVDTTTGNFAIDGDNGSAFRSISDNVVTRLVATDPWSPIDAGAADVIQPFGLEQALQVQDVLPGSIRSFTTVDDQDAGIFRLDYAAATNGEPEAMNAWATRFGVDFLAAELLITLQVDDAGYVEAFSVGLPDEAPAFRYLLDELYDATAPQIML